MKHENLSEEQESIYHFASELVKQMEMSMLAYLTYPLFEQIEKVRNSIDYFQKELDRRNYGKRQKKEPELKAVKILDEIRKALIEESAQVQNPEEYKRQIERKIRVLLMSQTASGMFDAFFRFMFTQALIGNGTHILDMDFRHNVRARLDLLQTSAFKDALFEIINPAFLLPANKEDTTYFWNETRSIELLAKYNRLKLIIENCRKRLKKDRKLEKEIQLHFQISDEWMNLINSTENVKNLALEWALNLMDVENQMKEFYKVRKSKKKDKISSLDLNFEHLHTRILRKARNNFTTKNPLVYFNKSGIYQQFQHLNTQYDDVTKLTVRDLDIGEVLSFFGKNTNLKF